jgi:hypothetical protein
LCRTGRGGNLRADLRRVSFHSVSFSWVSAPDV